MGLNCVEWFASITQLWWNLVQHDEVEAANLDGRALAEVCALLICEWSCLLFPWQEFGMTEDQRLALKFLMQKLVHEGIVAAEDWPRLQAKWIEELGLGGTIILDLCKTNHDLRAILHLCKL